MHWFDPADLARNFGDDLGQSSSEVGASGSSPVAPPVKALADVPEVIDCGHEREGDPHLVS